MEEQIRRMQIEINELQDLLRGKGLEGGAIQGLLRLADMVHGTKENPGGLVKRVDALEQSVIEIKGWIQKGIGMAFAINIGWIVFTHFSK